MACASLGYHLQVICEMQFETRVQERIKAHTRDMHFLVQLSMLVKLLSCQCVCAT